MGGQAATPECCAGGKTGIIYEKKCCESESIRVSPVGRKLKGELGRGKRRTRRCVKLHQKQLKHGGRHPIRTWCTSGDGTIWKRGGEQPGRRARRTGNWGFSKQAPAPAEKDQSAEMRPRNY